MTAGVITMVAVAIGIAWLAVLAVSAIRNRGSEEISHNLAPGQTNAELETRRLEKGQKYAIAFSAFLAISLPLYFLGEQQRQDSFVEEFSDDSVTRGEHVVEEFACFSCHGPEGVGGSASFIEKRSGVTVSWEAPSLNDVLYRYDEDELNFWITFGRGNTPMPAWGLAGGGSLNEAQVVDVVNYLKTIQVPQAEVLEELDPAIDVQLDRLANADATIAAAILNQRQVLADIDSAQAEFDALAPLAERADELLDSIDVGLDTDADGVADSVESELSDLTAEAGMIFQTVEPIELDPETPDAELADEAISQLTDAIDRDPILETNLAAVEAAVSEGVVDATTGLTSVGLETLATVRDAVDDLGVSGIPLSIDDADDAAQLVIVLEEAAAVEDADPALSDMLGDAQSALDDSADPDGDGLSTAAEATITSQIADAASKVVPPEITVVNLDPANPATVGGVADARTVRSVAGNMGTLMVNLRVTSENQDRIKATEGEGLMFLEAAQQRSAWEVDFEGVATAMGSDVEAAMRAVGIFNANCARCHTAGFSAGVPYTQETGSGGFGPALWDGRPLVQFGAAPENAEDDLLLQFLVRGSESETPYGLNGFGSGRMPSFGPLLSADDLQLLARYLRSGNLDGKADTP